MAALIEAAKAQDFPAEIVVVISNRADAGGLARRSASGVPTAIIESKPFGKDRAAFEAGLQSALDEHQGRADLPRRFHAAVDRRIRAALVWPDAQHPSLAAAFVSRPRSRGLRRCEAGVKISGATVHFVIPETDAGPIVMQGAVAVRDDDTPETLAARILERRAPHLSRCAEAACGRWHPPRRRFLQNHRQYRARRPPDLAGVAIA